MTNAHDHDGDNATIEDFEAVGKIALQTLVGKLVVRKKEENHSLVLKLRSTGRPISRHGEQ